MSRRRIAVALTSLMALAAPAVAQASPPQRSTTDRLGDRRYVVAGDRAYAVGAEDGSFPAMGFHTRGEMGGVWAPPLKLVDGLWFSVDGQWLPAASRFTSGSGYVRLDGAGAGGLQVRRTQVVPDGERGLLVGLTLRSATARTVTVGVDAHSELLSGLPVGRDDPEPAHGQRAGQRRLRRRRPAVHRGGPGLDGARRRRCHAGGPRRRRPAPRAAGPGRRLRRRPARGRRPRRRAATTPPTARAPAAACSTAWTSPRAAAPTCGSPSPAPSPVRPRPARRCGACSPTRPPRWRRRSAPARRSTPARSSACPATRASPRGVDWSKQNLADAVQEAHDLQVRVTNAGKAYPAPSGTVGRVRFFAAGFPDYPWLFATDGEYTDFAAVALGQFGVAADHLRALAAVSRVANGSSGKIVHEVVTDGSVYFGANADAGNTDESAKFPSTVALVWRWTGDRAFLRELYPAARAAAPLGRRRRTRTATAGPRAPATSSARAWAPRSSTTPCTRSAASWDLGDLAEARGDRATARWARNEASRRRMRFEAAWWMPGIPGYADSLVDPGDHQLYQRYWIGATPMEAEVVRRGRSQGGLADAGHAAAALVAPRDVVLRHGVRPVPHRGRRAATPRRRTRARSRSSR